MTELEQTTLDELIEEFAFFDDWEERYRYIIDLGKELPEFPEEARTEENRVHGCQSNVWLVPDIDEGPPPRIRFVADSDAHIVRGLIGVLIIAYSGKTAREILDLDIQDAFKQLGLDKHLSPTRSNGFYAMVKRIRTLAEAVQS